MIQKLSWMETHLNQKNIQTYQSILLKNFDSILLKNIQTYQLTHTIQTVFEVKFGDCAFDYTE